MFIFYNLVYHLIPRNYILIDSFLVEVLYKAFYLAHINRENINHLLKQTYSFILTFRKDNQILIVLCKFSFAKYSKSTMPNCIYYILYRATKSKFFHTINKN